ncbi:MAG: S-layer protein, partial [Candidatus Nanohaloarchaea archaeon]
SEVQTPDFVQYEVEATGTDEEVDLVRNNEAEPGVLYTQPENDDDDEEAYVWEVDLADNTADIASTYTGDEEVDDMDDEDVEVGYDEYGAYREFDTEDSDEESFTLNVPGAQSTSGMAFTGEDGALSAEGGGSGSVTSMSPTYNYADGVLDSDSNVGQVQNSDNLVLVGGPSVNSLVAELADEGDTWSADEYTEGEGLIQHVPNAFADGQDAVIVAGYSGEDTRAAGEFLADYRNNEGDLEGNQQVTISTESGQVVE